MTSHQHPDAWFAAEVAALLPDIGLRIERNEDGPFRIALFVACSALAGTLPLSMIEQQAKFQDQGYRTAFPLATRWIVLRNDQPIGRIIIDWGIDSLSHCVDLALFPAEQGAGLGTYLLQAWVTVSDRLGRATRLEVLANHGARGAYGRLGFVAIDDNYQPNIIMVRPVGG